MSILRSRLARTLVTSWVVLACGVGCDPKLTGTDDDNNNNPPPAVTDQARIFGQLVALQMDLIRAGLQEADDYNSPTAGSTRSIFTASCITATVTDAVVPLIELSLDTCVDNRGTEYRGLVTLSPPLDSEDAYIMTPSVDPADRILATNTANAIYNHAFHSGTLTFTFQRETGGMVNGMAVANYLRFEVQDELVSMTFLDTEFTGAIGSFGEFPASGGSIQAAWNGVGTMTVDFKGTGTAEFTMSQVNYLLNLSTGEVSLGVNE